MADDTRHGDQRDERLDIDTALTDKDIDEEVGGFQNVEGPGARRGERAIGSRPGSEEARALDRGEEVEDLDVGPGVDSATTGSPNVPATGTGKQTGSR